MKRFILLLAFFAAHTLVGVPTKRVRQPLSAAVLNDPCYISGQASMDVWKQLKNDPHYKSLQQNFHAVAKKSGYATAFKSPEYKALNTFTDNQQSLFKEKHPELQKAYAQCQVIQDEISALQNKLNNTPEAKAAAAANAQLDALLNTFPGTMNAAQQKKANAEINALYTKLEPVFDKQQKAQQAFLASQGYTLIPQLGYRKTTNAH